MSGASTAGRSNPASACRPRVPAESFDRLYAQSEDPWAYDSSAYEQAKYSATIAALEQRHFDRALEVGCSIGAFTERLAKHCAVLTAIDFSAYAVKIARGRLRSARNVQVVQASFPEQAPPGDWDLVVCSEVLYYLDGDTLEAATRWLGHQLSLGATVLCVDWRGPITNEPHDGDQVHDLLTERLGNWHALDAREPGYRLDRFDGDVS